MHFTLSPPSTPSRESPGPCRGGRSPQDNTLGHFSPTHSEPALRSTSLPLLLPHHPARFLSTSLGSHSSPTNPTRPHTLHSPSPTDRTQTHTANSTAPPPRRPPWPALPRRPPRRMSSSHPSSRSPPARRPTPPPSSSRFFRLLPSTLLPAPDRFRSPGLTRSVSADDELASGGGAAAVLHRRGGRPRRAPGCAGLSRGGGAGSRRGRGRRRR